ncbi:mRNA-capping enzyme-like protein [Carex littledalei]|uniref:mRNA guanylyltransferase n=1 Tax=Carex littledalei TaxID=544730 RepID=A0A833R6V2_9POAL|nr:mRNA-capping enzyme-like protein [Carex littledalei]
MDLNASPLPEDDEQPYADHIESVLIQEERPETAVETLRREREERRKKMKKERELEERGPKRHASTVNYDSKPQYHGYKIKELPQGWLDCPAFGQCIDKLIPSKVPLDETYNESVPPGKRYSSKQLITKQKKAGHEIGLVLDLTNTTRYYSTQEWTKLGIKHLKIPCKGRDSVPDNESVNEFVFEVMHFLDRQKNLKNPKYIVVHCTHGHNRTGFMIVHYLMRSQVLSVAQALNIFAERRPPGIYKPDYIQALYDFYHEVPENMVCPSTPEWKRSSDLDLNGEAAQDDDDVGDRSTPSHEQIDNKNITNDDELGDKVPGVLQNILGQICYRLLEITPPHGKKFQFPGSHPVSLNSDNLQLLRQRYYYTTWKADGTRYMMLILREGCYLIDRNFSFRRVQMRFPLKNIHDGFHDMTLIDGEMIIDKIPEVGLKRRYLAYDLMALNGSSKVKLPFAERWKLIEEEIVRPRNYERKQFEVEGRSNPVYRYDMEPFGVRRKDFWLLSTVTKLLREFIPRLSHEADGLIFQGWDDPYVNRTHEGLLKWKYPEMNSVDFLFEIGSGNRHLLFLHDKSKKKLMDGARISFGDVEDINALSGKIVECSWNSDEDCWVCMRVRTDKNTPNEITTYRKVLRSIKDNITEDVLLGDISEIVRLPMYADRIPRLHHRRR